MPDRRWVNQSQPQTLVIAVFLLYIQAGFSILFGIDPNYRLVLDPVPFAVARFLLFGAGGVAAGYGIANEQKWGYQLGVAVAAVPLLLRLWISLKYQINPLRFDLIPLMFDIALFALLVHPMSREYQKIWFTNARRRAS